MSNEVEINGNNDSYVDFFAEVDPVMKFILGLEGKLPPKVFDDIFYLVYSFDIHLSGKQNDVFNSDDLEFYKSEFEVIKKRIISLLKAQFHRDAADMIENVGEIEKLNFQFGAIISRDAIRSRIEPSLILKISERIQSLLEGSLNLETVEDWCEFYKNRVSEARWILAGRKEGLLRFLANESLAILKHKVEKAESPMPKE